MSTTEIVWKGTAGWEYRKQFLWAIIMVCSVFLIMISTILWIMKLNLILGWILLSLLIGFLILLILFPLILKFLLNKFPVYCITSTHIRRIDYTYFLKKKADIMELQEIQVVYVYKEDK